MLTQKAKINLRHGLSLFQGEWILSRGDVCNNTKLHLFMYGVKCVNIGASKDPFLTRVSDFAVLFGNELDAEVSCIHLCMWSVLLVIFLLKNHIFC